MAWQKTTPSAYNSLGQLKDLEPSEQASLAVRESNHPSEVSPDEWDSFVDWCCDESIEVLQWAICRGLAAPAVVVFDLRDAYARQVAEMTSGSECIRANIEEAGEDTVPVHFACWPLEHLRKALELDGERPLNRPLRPGAFWLVIFSAGGALTGQMTPTEGLDAARWN